VQPRTGDRERRTFAVADHAVASTVMRDRAWDVVDIRPHLDALQASGGEDLSILSTLARSSLIYQSGREHLHTRRAIAAFLSPASVMRWQGVIDAAIEDALQRLATSETPDIVHDYADPIFVRTIGAMTGLAIDDERAILRSIDAARGLAEPLLPLRRLRQVQAAFAHLQGLLPTPRVEGQQPASAPILCDVLTAGTLPASVDASALAVSLIVAAHTAAESLSLAIAGLLREGDAAWSAAAAPGWSEARLDDAIRDYPSTLNLYRVATDNTRVDGCPVARGDVAAVHVAEINAGIRNARLQDRGAAGPPSFSFGEGAHRCPGAALARLILGRAIPALAARYPLLRLDEAGVRIARTRMVQAPETLPCSGTGVRRRAARFWEIGDPDLARRIATDDHRFGPPDMPRHLAALMAASGKDLSVAIRIARNAPFFLSGPRQATIRLLTLEVLGGNRLDAWAPMIDRTIARLLDALADREQVDLVAEFCDPLFRDVTGAVLGIHPLDRSVFDAVAPELQDLLEPLLSLRTILRLQAVCADLLGQVEAGERATDPAHPPSLLARLHAAAPPGFDEQDRRALVLVLYGASFNVAHTLANALHRLGDGSIEARSSIIEGSGASWLDRDLLPASASPRFIYRVARQDGAIDRFTFAAGDTMQLQLAEINRDLGAGHLAFGHGLHRCLGASLSRLIIRRALPALLARFPDFALAGEPTTAAMSQTVALTTLPATLGRSPVTPSSRDVHDHRRS